MRKVQLPQPSASQLATYIEAQQDAIFERWSRGVNRDDDIPSSETVDRETLQDHLPQMLSELCDFLRQDQQGDALDKMDDYTEIHGRQRWLQGFSLSEVLLEVDRFREILLIDIVRDFESTTAATPPAALHQIEHAIFRFTRDLIVTSAVEHTESSESKLLEVNEQLSDSNDQLATVNQALREEEAIVRERSLKDPLTNIANRRYLDTRLAGEIARCDRYAQPLAIVILDLDYFKKINDTHGHEVGDRVLKVIATQLLRHTRATDVVGRYGGEEFLLLLPNTTLKTAEQLVERVRVAMSQRIIKPLTQAVTGSFGIAEWQPGQDMRLILARADKAMYRAKSRGRNCIEIEPLTYDSVLEET